MTALELGETGPCSARVWARGEVGAKGEAALCISLYLYLVIEVSDTLTLPCEFCVHSGRGPVIICSRHNRTCVALGPAIAEHKGPLKTQ